MAVLIFQWKNSSLITQSHFFHIDGRGTALAIITHEHVTVLVRRETVGGYAVQPITSLHAPEQQAATVWYAHRNGYG